MKIVFASDHAGYALKQRLISFVQDLGHEVEDVGDHTPDPEDDYTDFVRKAAISVSRDILNKKGIVIGASGQGEAIAANRFKGIRAAVFYGDPGKHQKDAEGESLNMIASTRRHNDANVLAIGARFISEEEAKEAVKNWLGTSFEGEERHKRRIEKLDTI